MLLLLSLLCACAATPKPAPTPPPAPTPEQVFLEGEEPLFAQLDDHDAFAPLAQSFEAKVSILSDPSIHAYINAVGERVASHALPKGSTDRFSFRVINDPATMNAITFPGGYVYVYSGLLLTLRDEAELAGVLSHEIAHTTRRHIKAAHLVKETVDASEALTGSLLTRLMPKVREAARAGILATFSREQEHEADRLAMVYLVRAGYSPFALPDFLHRLGQTTQEARTPRTPVGLMMRAALEPTRLKALTHELINPNFTGSALTSSHPHPIERERLLRLLIDRLSFSPTDALPIRQTDAFLAFHKRLLARNIQAPPPTQDAP